MKIHKLSGTYQLDDFRFVCKTMANLLSLKRDLRGGGVPLRRISKEIIEGTVTAHDLNRWYPAAVRRLNRTERNV